MADNQVTQLDGTILTNRGKRLIDKVMAGRCKLDVQRGAFGSGTIPDGADPRAFDNLLIPVLNAVITQGVVVGNGEASFRMQVSTEGLEHGIFVSEVGLYALDPDDGEILYAYLPMQGDDREWIRAGGGLFKSIVFDFITIIDRIEEMEVNVAPGGLALLSDLENYAPLIHQHAPSDIDGLEEWMEENSGNFIKTSEKGVPGGVAMLDEEGKLPVDQLPGGGNAESVNGFMFREQGGLLQFSTDKGATWKSIPAVYQ